VNAEADKPSIAAPDHAPRAGPRRAWQPLTFGGVAAFAGASWRRVFVAQALTALLFAAASVWFLGKCCAPVITQEIQKMPDGASLTNGRLAGLPDTLASESKFLSITIATDDDADLDQSADLQIALRKDRAEVSTLLSSALGSVEFNYSDTSALDLSRSLLDPWWGAWRPVLLAGAGLAAVTALLLVWSALAWIYAPAAKLVAWFCDRQLSWPGAWRLACAALLPGAVLLALGVVLYGSERVDVFGLGYFGTVHLLVGWVYLLAAPAFLPRLSSEQEKSNPFHS